MASERQGCTRVVQSCRHLSPSALSQQRCLFLMDRSGAASFGLSLCSEELLFVLLLWRGLSVGRADHQTLLEQAWNPLEVSLLERTASQHKGREVLVLRGLADPRASLLDGALHQPFHQHIQQNLCWVGERSMLNVDRLGSTILFHDGSSNPGVRFPEWKKEGSFPSACSLRTFAMHGGMEHLSFACSTSSLAFLSHDVSIRGAKPSMAQSMDPLPLCLTPPGSWPPSTFSFRFERESNLGSLPFPIEGGPFWTQGVLAECPRPYPFLGSNSTPLPFFDRIKGAGTTPFLPVSPPSLRMG